MGLDPGTLAIIGMVGTGVSTLTSAVGAQQAGKAASAQANYQAQVASNNAEIAKRNADLSLQEGQAQQAQQNLKNKQRAGAIVAAQGANGITVGQGSAADVEDSSEKLGLLDSATIMSNAARKAYGFDTQAQSFEAESELDHAKASQAKSASDIKTVSTLLGGASSVANQYSKWQTVSDHPTTKDPFDQDDEDDVALFSFGH